MSNIVRTRAQLLIYHLFIYLVIYDLRSRSS